MNLILSSYSNKARRLGITLTILSNIPSSITNELDICVILANSLENALKACKPNKSDKIVLECNQYAEKTVIMVANPYSDNIEFRNGLPICTKYGHGLGTQSILSIAESHGGTARFSTENGIFTMKAIL